MPMSLQLLSFSNRLLFFLLWMVAISVLTGAYIFEYMGYKPCQLCLYGRIVWWAIIAMGVGCLLFKNQKMAFYCLSVSVLMLFANAGFSLFHMGVEYHWWEGLKSCNQNNLSGNSDLLLNNLFEKPVPCDKAAVRIFSLSLAAYNAIISLAVAVFCLYMLRKNKKKGGYGE